MQVLLTCVWRGPSWGTSCARIFGRVPSTTNRRAHSQCRLPGPAKHIRKLLLKPVARYIRTRGLIFAAPPRRTLLRHVSSRRTFVSGQCNAYESYETGHFRCFWKGQSKCTERAAKPGETRLGNPANCHAGHAAPSACMVP